MDGSIMVAPRAGATAEARLARLSAALVAIEPKRNALIKQQGPYRLDEPEYEALDKRLEPLDRRWHGAREEAVNIHATTLAALKAKALIAMMHAHHDLDGFLIEIDMDLCWSILNDIVCMPR